MNTSFILIDQLIRSKRRSIGLEITKTGELIIRAPKRASQKEIERVIQEKQQWIVRHQMNARAKVQATPVKQFTQDETFLYLGNAYPLRIMDDDLFYFHFDQQYFYLSALQQPIAKNLFLKWYREQAREKIIERADWFAAENNLQYKNIKINDAKRQWGACSVEGVMSFTWRLIMAPLPVLDYVVVHELAHLVYKNHSRRFWRKVESMLPSFREQQRWLKTNDHLLKL